MLSIYKIQGRSMLPHFRAGDYVLIRYCRRLKAGDLIVYQHFEYGDIFKRVVNVEAAGFWLKSDNSVGLKPSQIGLCTDDRIKGKLLWHIKP